MFFLNEIKAITGTWYVAAWCLGFIKRNICQRIFFVVCAMESFERHKVLHLRDGVKQIIYHYVMLSVFGPNKLLVAKGMEKAEEKFLSTAYRIDYHGGPESPTPHSSRKIPHVQG